MEFRELVLQLARLRFPKLLRQLRESGQAEVPTAATEAARMPQSGGGNTAGGAPAGAAATGGDVAEGSEGAAG